MSIYSNVNILIYTRKPEKEYTESLSNSIHLAYQNESGDFQPLNQNYGILFPSATIDDKNVIHEKGLKNPYLFRMKDGSFGMIAVRVTKEGNDDRESKGHILLWTSKNLISFCDHGLMKLCDDLWVREARCEFNHTLNVYEIHWQDNKGDFYINKIPDILHNSGMPMPVKTSGYPIDSAVQGLPNVCCGNVISVDKEIGDEIRRQWTPIYNTEIMIPNRVNISSLQQLQEVTATAVYSDGSTALKQVKWEADQIDFSKSGCYDIKGKITEKTYPFPLAIGYADPVILPWKNKYYFISTNDNKDDIGLYVREGETITDLFQHKFKEAIILNVDEERDFIQTFWAPEFHMIGGDLYILFAVGGKIWGPQCHIMKLKTDGNIMNPNDWETPVRVKKSDGTFLAKDGITLDMTYFKANNTSCVLWSYREGLGTPFDTGSMIYIATIDETNPSIITSEPVLLTRPLFGWENIQGTINNEGPYALVTEDMVYITYSGGAAGGYTYSLGLLSIPCNGNYLDANAWKKASTPVLSYYSIEGIYGPGHNSFFRDYDGSIMIMYHGEVKIAAQDTRCSGMHRVHFDLQKRPVFNLSNKRDLDPSLAQVTIKVIIE